jgi:hypothetical protein
LKHTHRTRLYATSSRSKRRVPLRLGPFFGPGHFAGCAFTVTDSPLSLLPYTMADDERNNAYRISPTTHWSQSPRIYSHSHHGTPAQEYTGFNFSSPHMPMEPSAFSSSMQHRPMHQQLQPLVMPQWPSMLGSSQAHPNYQPVYPPPVQPIQPMTIGSLQTPISATSTRSASTPRKTLTDLDRKRMCQYAEEHPNSKQTEIGGAFFEPQCISDVH